MARKRKATSAAAAAFSVQSPLPKKSSPITPPSSIARPSLSSSIASLITSVSPTKGRQSIATTTTPSNVADSRPPASATGIVLLPFDNSLATEEKLEPSMSSACPLEGHVDAKPAVDLLLLSDRHGQGWGDKLGSIFSPLLSLFPSNRNGEAGAATVRMPPIIAAIDDSYNPNIDSTLDDTPDESYEYYSLDDDASFDVYDFISKLPPPPDDQRLRPPCLPRKTRNSPRVSLVLDLDETLVHSTTQPISDADLVFPVAVLDQGERQDVYVKIRPYFHRFIEEVHKRFEVVIFTASHKVYANALLDLLDPSHSYFRHRLFRDSCLMVDGNYLKDLSVIGRDMASTVIVDNSPLAFGYNLANAIPIESWFGSEDDDELLKLLPLLRRLEAVEDVRPTVAAEFQLHKNPSLQSAPDWVWGSGSTATKKLKKKLRA